MLWRDLYGNGRRFRALAPRPSLWREMRRFQRDMDHFLGGTAGPIQTSFPAVNAWVGDEGVVVTAEIPGVAPEEIEITVNGNVLTLKGQRTNEALPEGATFRRRERRHGEFSRSLELPFRVDVEQVKASFDKGVLQIELPRIAEEKPRKITIKSA